VFESRRRHHFGLIKLVPHHRKNDFLKSLSNHSKRCYYYYRRVEAVADGKKSRTVEIQAALTSRYGDEDFLK
jgi:hypothetical protein